MNVLFVFAHPEPRALNGGLKSFAVVILNHQVIKYRFLIYIHAIQGNT